MRILIEKIRDSIRNLPCPEYSHAHDLLDQLDVKLAELTEPREYDDLKAQLRGFEPLCLKAATAIEQLQARVHATYNQGFRDGIAASSKRTEQAEAARDRAVAETVERCAKIASDLTFLLSCSHDGHGIAKAIRSLAPKAEKEEI